MVTVTLNGLADWAAGTTGMVRDTTVGFKINYALARDNAASDTTAVLMRVAVVNAGGSSATWGATDSLFIILQGSNGSITSATSSTGTQTWKTLAVYATVWSGFNLIRDASVDILATGRSFGTIATPTLATLALGGVLIRTVDPAAVGAAPTLGWNEYRIIRVFDTATAGKTANFETLVTGFIQN